MDGTQLIAQDTPLPGGLARPDALKRIVFYGEALRAMTDHVSDALITSPCVPMIDMLDDAYDRMSETRPGFTPEEYTLYVMSQMLGLCEDADEKRQFQIGAAQYIVKAAGTLPEAYGPIVADARLLLRKSGIDTATAEAASPPQPQRRPAAALPSATRPAASEPEQVAAPAPVVAQAPVAAEATVKVQPSTSLPGAAVRAEDAARGSIYTRMAPVATTRQPVSAPAAAAPGTEPTGRRMDAGTTAPADRYRRDVLKLAAAPAVRQSRRSRAMVGMDGLLAVFFVMCLVGIGVVLLLGGIALPDRGDISFR